MEPERRDRQSPRAIGSPLVMSADTASDAAGDSVTPLAQIQRAAPMGSATLWRSVRFGHFADFYGQFTGCEFRQDRLPGATGQMAECALPRRSALGRPRVVGAPPRDPHAILLTPQKNGSGPWVTPVTLVRQACCCR
jgi:hypothetical protein